MTAALLDENHLVIQEFKPEPVTLDPDSDDCSWRQVSNNLSLADDGSLGPVNTSVGGQMLTQCSYAYFTREQAEVHGGKMNLNK